MSERRIQIWITVGGLVLGALILLAGSAVTSNSAGPRDFYSDIAAIRDTTSWSSGWVDIAPGTAITLTHNLGGNPDDYVGELWFRDTDPGGKGINRWGMGGFEAGGNFRGVHRQNLTDTTIQIVRRRDDAFADQVHLRIWIADPPAWDSGWVDIAPGTLETLAHNLGGDVDDYVVGLWFKDTTPGGIGVNARCYGGFEAGGQFRGAAWQNLTDTTIDVWRYLNDDWADQVRVRIFVPDPPDWDSGWVDLTPGTVETLSHNLGGNQNLYIVRGWQKDTDGGMGINHRYTGGFETGGSFFGSNWQNLTDTSISLFRWADDPVADQVRVRIWRPEYPVYLPFVAKGYPPPPEQELAYDDGAMDTNTSWETGKGFAVRFTPPGQVQLMRARYYLLDPRPIEVHVWDANRTDLITPFTANTNQDGWNDVDLSAYNITVSGDFYVGFLHLEDYRPTLGVDTTSADLRSFEVDGAYWEQQTSDYMMRAVIVER